MYVWYGTIPHQAKAHEKCLQFRVRKRYNPNSQPDHSTNFLIGEAVPSVQQIVAIWQACRPQYLCSNDPFLFIVVRQA